MSTTVQQFRENIVRPVLNHLGLWSQAAENLVVGTALQESGLRFFRQVGTGPARGFMEMEPNTYNDIWDNFLKYHTDLATKVNQLSLHPLPAFMQVPADQMMGNVYFAVAMCRVHYYRVSESLPAADDIAGLANYWKNHYNSAGGAGDVQEFINNYRALNG